MAVATRSIALLFAVSYLARVPVTAITLGLILVLRESGRGYDLAGLATGAYVIGLSVTAPFIGRLADRFGAPRVFLMGAPLCTIGLLGLVAGADSLPVPALLALATLTGAALPPLGALTRGLMTPLLSEERRTRLFAIDATAQELCFIGGPLVLAGLIAVGTASQALVVIAGMLAAGAVLYWGVARRLPRTSTADAEELGPAPWRFGGLRALLIVTVLVGAMFGAIELSIAAALEDHGSRDLAGTFLAIWSAGSLIGGLAAVRWPGRRLERRQQALLAGATLSALLLVPAATSPTLLAGALFLHGFTQAPLMAVGYAIVPRVVEGRLSEAFSWLTSAVVGGIAIGTALAGSASDAFGAGAGFLIGALAPATALGLALAFLRSAR
jgi:MFS family permease